MLTIMTNISKLTKIKEIFKMILSKVVRGYLQKKEVVLVWSLHLKRIVSSILCERANLYKF